MGINIIVVTAAIIMREGKILVAQRNKGVDQALKWEFPGGKVEPGESLEECLVREIKEELGFTINVGKIFEVISHVYGDRQIILLCYLCTVIAGEPQSLDCRDFRWVGVDELIRLDLAEADRRVAKQLHNMWYDL